MTAWPASIVICTGVATLFLGGCVRTHDGSIEPQYGPRIEYFGPMPLVTIRPIPHSRGEFPRSPKPPAPPTQYEQSRPVRAAPRVRRVAPPPAPAPSADQRLSCGPAATVNGRVRVDCE